MPRQRKKRTLGETLIEYMEKKPQRSANQLARELTALNVPTDKRKVMRWRAAREGQRIAPDAAAALDRVFKTINVFGQYAYKPEHRGTRAALDAQIKDLLAAQDELRRRLDNLEGGNA